MQERSGPIQPLASQGADENYPVARQITLTCVIQIRGFVKALRVTMGKLSQKELAVYEGFDLTGLRV